jgi:hypothetical protein
MDMWNHGEANFVNVSAALAERNMRRRKRSRFKLVGVRILEIIMKSSVGDWNTKG